MRHRKRTGAWGQAALQLGGLLCLVGCTATPTQGIGPEGLRVTGNPLDWAIAGQGYFQLKESGTGKILYTRGGAFALSDLGAIVTRTAPQRPLEPLIIVSPDQEKRLVVTPDGYVLVPSGSEPIPSPAPDRPFGTCDTCTPIPPQAKPVGRVQLALIEKPEGLLRRRDGLFEIVAGDTAVGRVQVLPPSATPSDGASVAQPGSLVMGTLEYALSPQLLVPLPTGGRR